MTSMAPFNAFDDPEYLPVRPESQKHLTREEVDFYMHPDPMTQSSFRPHRTSTARTTAANRALFDEGGALNSQTTESQHLGFLSGRFRADVPEAVGLEKKPAIVKSEGTQEKVERLDEFDDGDMAQKPSAHVLNTTALDNALKQLSETRNQLKRADEEIEELRGQVFQGLKHCEARDVTIKELEHYRDAYTNALGSGNAQKGDTVCRTCQGLRVSSARRARTSLRRGGPSVVKKPQ